MNTAAPSPPCRVVVVDDHDMIRESISGALGRWPDLEVVGTAGTVAEALRVVAATNPDVAVVDFALPDGTGVELAGELREREPSVPSLILTASEGVDAAAAAVAGGCAGFLHKSADLDALVCGVRRVHEGEALFDAQTLSAAIDWLRQPPPPPVDLSTRELEILQHLAYGSSTAEIADELVLSHHTVRNHVRNALHKLGARSQLEAVVVASSLSLVDVGRRRPSS